MMQAMVHALDLSSASPVGNAKVLPQALASTGTRDSWPFQPVYLWDAPTRLAPLLLTVGIAVLLALARTGMDTFVPKHVLSALMLCLPWWALFHGAWPLLGPRRRQLWAHLRQRHWRASLARWSPRVLGPGPLAMATRLAVFALVLSAAQKATLEPTTAHTLLSLALLLMLLQTCVTAWQLRRAGERVLPALQSGQGTGLPSERLPDDARFWAVALLLAFPACWLWLLLCG